MKILENGWMPAINLMNLEAVDLEFQEENVGEIQHLKYIHKEDQKKKKKEIKSTMKTFNNWLQEGMVPGPGGQAGGASVGYNNPSNPPGGFAQYEDPDSKNKEVECQKCGSKQDVRKTEKGFICMSCQFNK